MRKIATLILLTCMGFSQSSQSQTNYRSEEDWIKYFQEKSEDLDPIEGIWSANMVMYENFTGETQVHNLPDTWHKVIVKNASGVYVTYSYSTKNGTEGDKEYLTTFTPTAVKNIYIYSRSGGKNPISHKANAVLKDNNVLQYTVEGGATTEWTLIKIYPTTESKKNKSVESSGTGFAVSSDGYIVTNSHVINNAQVIKVKGINGSFQFSYRAKVVGNDRTNDLAVIQIDDPSFKNLGNIPYAISNKTADAGSSVFVLGYPLRAKMGDEIKLTNGIVSSKSGYQGDITTYQISAPVQPGNSGGPMFDSKGYLIGIVNAKLVGAENASYAIKASYLLNLLETLDKVPKLPTGNSLVGKSLPEQVKIIKNFTYIIEVQ